MRAGKLVFIMALVISLSNQVLDPTSELIHDLFYEKDDFGASIDIPLNRHIISAATTLGNNNLEKRSGIAYNSLFALLISDFSFVFPQSIILSSSTSNNLGTTVFGYSVSGTDTLLVSINALLQTDTSVSATFYVDFLIYFVRGGSASNTDVKLKLYPEGTVIATSTTTLTDSELNVLRFKYDQSNLTSITLNYFTLQASDPTNQLSVISVVYSVETSDYSITQFEDFAGTIYCFNGYFYDGTSCVACKNHQSECLSLDFTYCDSTSSYWSLGPTASTCPLDFIDFSKFSTAGTIEVNAPIAPEWTFTIDFWIWIKNSSPTTTAYKIIYKDFMSIVVQNSSTASNVYCIPMEYHYNIESDSIDFSQKETDWASVIMTKSTSNSTYKWNYVRCAFSAVQEKGYIMVDTTTATTKSYANVPRWEVETGISGSPTFRPVYRKFYTTATTVKLRLMNFLASANNVFLKNLNIFDSYMSENLDWRYYNLSSSNFRYTHVIFSMPFSLNLDDLNLTFYSIDTSFVKTTSTYTIPTTPDLFSAPINFRRLSTFELNYSSNDMMTFATTDLIDATASYLVDSTNSILSCTDTSSPTNQFYSFVSNSCTDQCDTGYSREAFMTTFHLSYYCTNICSNTTTCPSDKTSTSSLTTNLTCSNLEFLFSCYSSISENKDNTALQYSYYFDTHPITIDFGTAITSYTLDIWIYPDHYVTMNNLPLVDYFKGKRLFLTDSFSVNYSSDGTKVELKTASDTIQRTEGILSGWTHLVLTAYSSIGYFSTQHNFDDKITFTANPDLNKIYFCNSKYSGTQSKCDTDFIDAFYSKLRIFKDLMYNYALIDSMTYTNSEVVLYFSFKLDSLIDNKIACTSGCDSFTITVTHGSITNTDGYPLFNMGNYYSQSSIGQGMLLDTVSESTKNLITINSKTSCDSACNMCFDTAIDKCYSCKTNYILAGGKCYSSLTYNSDMYTYYQDKTSDVDLKFTLSVSLTTQATFFMFVKFNVLDFTSTHCIIKLHDDICINADSANTLTLYNSSTSAKYFETAVFAESKKWIPISVSFSKLSDTRYPAMMSMTYKTTLLEYKSTDYPDVIMDKVVIPKDGFDGFISLVTVFNKFIINPYGIIKSRTNFNSLLSSSFAYITGVSADFFNMRGTSVTNCYDSSSLTTKPTTIKCISEYNPYLDYSLASSNQDQFYLDSSNAPAFADGSTTYCCDDTSKCIRKGCDNASNLTGTLTETNWSYDTCDNFSYDSRQLVKHTTLKEILCKKIAALNFHAFNPITFNYKPTGTAYKISFSLYSYLYDSTVTTSRFKITLDWSTYLTVVVEQTADDLVLVKCSGLGSRIITAELTTIINTNLPIECGINTATNLIQLKVSTRLYEVTDSSMSTFTSQIKAFTITEASTDNYGITNLTNLKFYNCLCTSVSVTFDGLQLTSGFYQDSTATYKVTPTKKSAYLGFNIYDTSTVPVDPVFKCPEISNFEYKYYDYGLAACSSTYNYNLLEDITFDSVPSSMTYERYTLSTWIYLDDHKSITGSISYIYHQHLVITLISSGSNLVVKCYPNYLIDQTTGEWAADASDLTAFINSDSLNITDASYIWTLITCSVNLPLGKFYVNGNTEKDLLPKTSMSATATNFATMRKFVLPITAVKAYINGISAQSVRVFIKNFVIIQDYVPQTLYANYFYFKDISLIINNAVFKSLVAFYSSMDSSDVTVTGTTSATITYTINGGTATPTASINQKAANTYTFASVIYPLTLCSLHQQKDITSLSTISYKTMSPNSCVDFSEASCSTDYCLYTHTPNAYRYWCDDNAKLLRTSDLSCQTLTESDYTKNSKFSYIDLTKYDNTGSCSAGETQFYFNCILDSYNAGIYFSGGYGFTDMTFTLASELASKQIFGLEIWFYPISLSASSTETYYLIAPPHNLYLKSSKLYYKFDTTETQLTPVPNINEWNILYIQSKADGIKIYFNSNLVREEASSSDLTGLFFCNKSTTCPITLTDYPNLVWSEVFYKNIRLWKDSYTYSFIQNISLNTSSLINSYLVLSFDFQISNLTYQSSGVYKVINKVTAAVFDLSISPSAGFNRGVNIGTNYDLVVLNNKLTQTYSGGSLATCASNCNRCFAPTGDYCYECIANYKLINLVCLSTDGSFFMSSITEDIKLKTTNPLSDYNKLTITFFFKPLNRLSDTSITTVNSVDYYNLISFDSSANTGLMYNSSDYFVVILKDKLAYKIAQTATYIEKWNFFGLSIYRSTDSVNLVPDIAGMQFNRVIQAKESGYVFEAISIDQILIKKDFITMYASLSVYNSFINGPYGIALNFDAKNFYNRFRIDYFQFSKIVASNTNSIFSTSSNCIIQAQINTGTSTSTGCTIDNEIQFRSSKNCVSNDITGGGSCSGCDSECSYSTSGYPSLEISCFNKGSAFTDCSCFLQRFNYYMTEDDKCGIAENLNLNYLDDVSLPVKRSTVGEYTLEAWIYVMNYNTANFSALDIVWDNHLRIFLDKTTTAGKYKGTCYPFVDKADLNKYIALGSTDSMDTAEIAYDAWKYIRCSVGYYEPESKFYITADDLSTLTDTLLPPQAIDKAKIPTGYTSYFSSSSGTTTTTLDIKFTTSNPNYGLFYLRELKLFDSFLFGFYNTSNYYLLTSPSKLSFLLNYFIMKNTLNDDPTDTSFKVPTSSTAVAIIYDSVSTVSTSINSVALSNIEGLAAMKTTFPNSLSLCPDNKYWDTANTACTDYQTVGNECTYQFDASLSTKANCLKCASNKFLHLDNVCYTACPDGYGGDPRTGMCRKCHSTCLTCVGIAFDDCLVCITSPQLYLVKNDPLLNGRCITRCEDYSRILDDPNKECIKCVNLCHTCTVGSPYPSYPSITCARCSDRCNNFNEYSDIEFDVPSKDNNPVQRYSIGAWVYLDPLSSFNYGLKLIYDKHVSLYLTKSTNDVSLTCFPQDYRTKTTGKSQASMTALLGSSSKYNFLATTVASCSQKWAFYFCSVDLPLGKYYVNSSAITDINPKPTSNYYRDLNTRLPSGTSFKAYIQDANNANNGGLIFIRNFLILSDYLPQSVYSLLLFFKDLSQFADYSASSILFYTNIELLKTSNDISYTNTAGSQVVTPTYSDTTYTFLSTVIDFGFCAKAEINDSSVVSSYVSNKDRACIGTPICDSTDYCLKTNKSFWCPAGKYLNDSTFVCETTSDTKTREPDSTAYKTMNCSANKYNNCPDPTYTLNADFTCQASRTKLFFDCITDTDYQSNSGLYFSNSFSFRDIDLDLSAKAYDEYYIEFWIYIDATNDGHNSNNPVYSSTNKYHYFMPLPSAIYIENNTLKFTDGTTITSSTQTYNKFEWMVFYLSVSKNPSSTNSMVRLYVNESLDAPAIDVNTSVTMTLTSIRFCSEIKNDYTCATPTDTFTNKKWGFAWYKRIKIWNNRFWLHPRFIQEHSWLYDKTQINLLNHYDFSLKNIKDNGSGLYETYDLKDDKSIFVFAALASSADYDKQFNYSLKYDYIVSNSLLGKYRTGLSATSTCPSTCNRCYDGSNCYECNGSNKLIVTGCGGSVYYLKQPGLSEKEIELITDDTKPKLSELDKFTVTLFVKIISVSETAVSTDEEHGIIYFDAAKTNRLVLYRTTYTNHKLRLYLNDELANEYSIQAKLQRWVHIGISIQRSLDVTVYDHMLHFFVDRELIPKQSTFDIKTQAVTFTTIIINHQVYALYSDIRYYNSYLVGSYGIVRSNNIGSIYLLKAFSLQTTNAAGSCLDVATQVVSTTEVLQNTVICNQDYYIKVLDSTTKCSDNKSFLFYNNYENSASENCTNCMNECILDIPPDIDYTDDRKINESSCYDTTQLACSCFLNKYSFYLLGDACRPHKSLNISFIDNINFPVKISVNDEMTLEFWMLVHSYIPSTFSSMELIWDGHLRVILVNEGKDLKAYCYPYVEHNTDLTKYKNTYVNDSIAERKWYFIRCSVDRRITREKFYMNRVSAVKVPNYRQLFDFSNYIQKNLIVTSLTDNQRNYQNVLFRIKDNNLDANYGLTYIRELKFFSAYLSESYNTRYKKISKERFLDMRYLLHYFELKNTLFDRQNTNSDLGLVMRTQVPIYDLVESSTTTSKYLRTDVTVKRYDTLRGYQVFDYDLSMGFTICPENQYWYGDCYNDSTTDCRIATNPQICLLCAKGEFLYNGNACFSTCPVNYYEESFLSMCRECHDDCYTCTDKYNYSCTSCIEPLYYYPDKYSMAYCIPDCNVHGLLKYSYAIPDFDSFKKAECVSSEMDVNVGILGLDTSKSHAPAEISQLTANITYVNQKLIDYRGEVREIRKFAQYDFAWIFNATESQSINDPTLYSSIPDHFSTDPFLSSTLNQTVQIKPNYFQKGLKYVFLMMFHSYVDEYKNNTNTVYKKFVVKISKSPFGGNMKVNPLVGIESSTDFFITCSGWQQDSKLNTTSQLQYRITSTYLDSDAGFDSTLSNNGKALTNQELGDPYSLNRGEIIIQDYSIISSISSKFILNPGAVRESRYKIECKVKDAVNLVSGYSDIITVKAYNSDSYSNQIASMFDLNTLSGTKDEMALNAKFTSDEIFSKGEIAKTTKLLITLVGNQNYIKANKDSSQSECSDDYCNKQGKCSTISNSNSINLVCSCNTGWSGLNCQIDFVSSTLLDIIFNKVIAAETDNMQTTDPSIHTPIDINRINSELTTSVQGVLDLTYAASLYMDPASASTFGDKVKNYVAQLSLKYPEFYNKNKSLIISIYNNLFNNSLLKLSTSINANSNGNGTRLIEEDKNRVAISKNLKQVEAFMKESLLEFMNSDLLQLDNPFMYTSSSPQASLSNSYIVTANDSKEDISFVSIDLFQNLHIVILKSDINTKGNFTNVNIDSLLKESRNLKLPYCQLEGCLNNIKSKLPRLFGLIFVSHRISPFIDLYQELDQSSMITVELYDLSNNTKIQVDTCTTQEAQIKLMFPKTKLGIVSDLGQWKDIFNSTSTLDENFYNDPFYIKPNGEVLNITLSDRLDFLSVQSSLKCSYIDPSFNLSTNGIKTLKSTSSDYIECTSTLLANFVLNYQLQKKEVSLNDLSSFFFLSRFEIYKWPDNYMNYSFILTIALLFLITVYCACKSVQKRNIQEGDIRQTVCKLNLPYHKDLIKSLGTSISQEQKYNNHNMEENKVESSEDKRLDLRDSEENRDIPKDNVLILTSELAGPQINQENNDKYVSEKLDHIGASETQKRDVCINIISSSRAFTCSKLNYGCLPSLSAKVTLSSIHNEILSHSTISCWDYFKNNMKSRNLIYTICRNLKKSEAFDLNLISLIIIYFSLAALFNTVLMCHDNSILEGNSSLNAKGACFAFITSVIMTFCLNIIVRVLYIGKQKMRNLYIDLKLEHESEFITELQSIRKKQVKSILILIGSLFFFSISFHFSFGLCAVYRFNQLEFLILTLVSVLLDQFLFEVLIQGIMACLYSMKSSAIAWILAFLDVVRIPCILNL